MNVDLREDVAWVMVEVTGEEGSATEGGKVRGRGEKEPRSGELIFPALLC